VVEVTGRIPSRVQFLEAALAHHAQRGTFRARPAGISGRVASKARNRSAAGCSRAQFRDSQAPCLRPDVVRRRRSRRNRQLCGRWLAEQALAPNDTPLTIADRTFGSRLIVGTGKYSSHAVMAQAHQASGAEMVTVAVRRVNISDRSRESLLDYVDTSRIFILPNTAGRYTPDRALPTARLGRETGASNWVQPEGFGHERPPFPAN